MLTKYPSATHKHCTHIMLEHWWHSINVHTESTLCRYKFLVWDSLVHSTMQILIELMLTIHKGSLYPCPNLAINTKDHVSGNLRFSASHALAGLAKCIVCPRKFAIWVDWSWVHHCSSIKNMTTGLMNFIRVWVNLRLDPKNGWSQYSKNGLEFKCPNCGKFHTPSTYSKDKWRLEAGSLSSP